MSRKTTVELLRERAAELKQEIDAKRAAAEPLRAARDKVVNDARAAEMELNAKIREAEAGLFELCNEQGAVAKALGGRSMSTPA